MTFITILILAFHIGPHFGLEIRDLDYTSVAFLSQLSSWTSNGSPATLTAYCGDYILRGKGPLTKLYPLPRHDYVIVLLDVYVVSSWISTEKLFVSANNYTQELSGKVRTTGSPTSYKCSNNAVYGISNLLIIAPSAGPNLNLTIWSNFDSSTIFFGIRNIAISPHNITYNPAICYRFNTSLSVEVDTIGPCYCKQASQFTLPPSCVGCSHTCADCPSTCSDCITMNATHPQCTRCRKGNFLSGVFCVTCSSVCKECIGSPTFCTSCNAGYYFYAKNNSCLPSCDLKVKTAGLGGLECYSPCDGYAGYEKNSGICFNQCPPDLENRTISILNSGRIF